jgi:hypothetical protein
MFIELEANLLISRLDQLGERVVKLGNEMEFADPVKDHDFEQFMVKISRALQSRHALKALSDSALAMQQFRLPLQEEVRCQRSEVSNLHVGAALAACPS